MRKTKIKVGLDFDGVVAYNPARIARPAVAYIKKHFFGVKKLEFWYPEHKWQQIFWVIMHESSVFPARGVELLKRLITRGSIEAHLITARYSFLDDHMDSWLRKKNLKEYFTTINLNQNDEQPHLFKEKIVKKYNLDYYIEDNWDIVRYMRDRVKTKVFWIYNIFDRTNYHEYKFPYLEKALKSIIDE